jgi:uncharacterized protein
VGAIAVDDASRWVSDMSMKPGVTSQTELALDELDDYLSSEASPDDCMQLSDLDGFLTGIVVGPELIMPSELLPVIWGDESPGFKSDEAAELIIGTIMGRYNEIVASLAADPPSLDPIFWRTKDDIVIAGDWAEGFMDAMSLRPIEWSEMLDDEEKGLPLIPIFALVGDEEGGALLGHEIESEMQLRAETSDLIPSCVIEIDAFWKARRGSTPETKGTLH